MAKRSRKRARRDEQRRAQDEQALAELALAHGLESELERLLAAEGTTSWRTDCDHYRSRTLATGDVVSHCRVDRAGPNGCPDDCEGFEPRGRFSTGAG